MNTTISIVHEVPSNRFVLYADRRIQQPETIAALTKAFHLQGHSVGTLHRLSPSGINQKNPD